MLNKRATLTFAGGAILVPEGERTAYTAEAAARAAEGVMCALEPIVFHPNLHTSNKARASTRPLDASGPRAGTAGHPRRRAKDTDPCRTPIKCLSMPPTRKKLGSWFFAMAA